SRRLPRQRDARRIISSFHPGCSRVKLQLGGVMNRFALLLSVAFALGFPVACAFADTTQPAPGIEHLKATVTGVEGLVQVRADENQPWQKATEGMVVGENAE